MFIFCKKFVVEDLNAFVFNGVKTVLLIEDKKWSCHNNTRTKCGCFDKKWLKVETPINLGQKIELALFIIINYENTLTARLVRWKIFKGNGIQIPWKTNYEENGFHCLVGRKEINGNMNSIVWLGLE